MILGHIFGIPVEETAAQFVPAGAATLAMITIAGRMKLGRLRRRFSRRMHSGARGRRAGSPALRR